MKWLQKFLATKNDFSLTILRVALGVMIFPHGAQKLLGWFGGPGFEGTIGFMGSMGVPMAVAVLVIIGEFFGGLSLIVGFIGRWCSFALALIMLGAIYNVHLQNGFFWSNGGFEFHMVTAAAALVIMAHGSGALSVDRLLVDKLQASSAAAPAPQKSPEEAKKEAPAA